MAFHNYRCPGSYPETDDFEGSGLLPHDPRDIPQRPTLGTEDGGSESVYQESIYHESVYPESAYSESVYSQDDNGSQGDQHSDNTTVVTDDTSSTLAPLKANPDTLPSPERDQYDALVETARDAVSSDPRKETWALWADAFAKLEKGEKLTEEDQDHLVKLMTDQCIPRLSAKRLEGVIYVAKMKVGQGQDKIFM